MKTNHVTERKKRRYTTSEKRFYFMIFLFILSGSIMIGHGTRMMYQGLFQPQSYYPAPTPNTIDFYFDWFTLALLGFIILGVSLHYFYKKSLQSYKEEKTSTKNNNELTYYYPT